MNRDVVKTLPCLRCKKPIMNAHLRIWCAECQKANQVRYSQSGHVKGCTYGRPDGLDDYINECDCGDYVK